jgi:hypothetical protein
MSGREKRLAVVLGGILVLLPLFFGFRSYSTGMQQRRDRISTLEDEIADKQFTTDLGARAADRILAYEKRSLPPEYELARAQYQTWLLELVEKTGFEKVDVRLESHTPGEVFYRLKFYASGDCNIEELTDFLHRFYSTNHLHRIQRLIVKPIGNSKGLDIKLSIDALSLPGSSNVKTLASGKSGRPSFGDLAEYQKVIVGRNMFGPPNNAPRMERVRGENGVAGESISVTLSASDADKLDQLAFRMEGDSLPGARIDSRTGRLSWTPREPGRYAATVRVYDDGFPSKFDEQVINFTVGERPPRVERTVTAPPTAPFDVAKHTVLQTIVEVNGRSEAWLTERTTGTKHKLAVGDEFEVGSIKGIVRRIDLRYMEIEVDGKLLLLSIRERLSDATEVSPAGA